MEKKYRDEELDQLINEQFIKEADIMAEALFSGDDDDTEEYDVSDEEIRGFYQKLMERIETEKNSDADTGHARTDPGMECADDAAETAYSGNEAGTAVPAKTPRFPMHRILKVAGVVIVSGLCVFAASMTSEANRNYFVKNVKYLVGDRTQIVLDNDDKNESANIEENEAIKEVEQQLGVDVPELLYRPKGLLFYQYELRIEAQFAKFEYLYNDNVWELLIDKEDDTTISDLYSLHGQEVAVVDIENENIHIAIQEMQDSQDKKPSYLAEWKIGNVKYYITGKIELEELIKILEELRFHS